MTVFLQDDSGGDDTSSVFHISLTLTRFHIFTFYSLKGRKHFRYLSVNVSVCLIVNECVYQCVHCAPMCSCVY